MRKQVLQIQCSRCDRVETLEEEVKPQAAHAFQARMGDLTVSWEDLCTPCCKTVKNHLEAIAKKVEGVSPDRKERTAKKKEEAPAAPPLSVTPSTVVPAPTQVVTVSPRTPPRS